ncbi:MAG: M18 family aminopeptidase [Defluviitaleaceae bacterium]|nr:M18 family aminopeptidase [Defluviitaleaceae bacterium]
MSKTIENAQKLLDYLYDSPSPFHATNNAAKQLAAAGFMEIFEGDTWDIKAGGKYFLRKNSSSFAAFIMGTGSIAEHGIRTLAAHTDSPYFVIKPNPQMRTGKHIKLNTSPYGGIIMHTWFDRPLSIAGRVLLKSDDFLVPCEKLVNINRPLLVIPSLAIHLNREVNNGYKINAQSDTLPFAALVNTELEKGDYLISLLTKELGCKAEDILDFDLCLYEFQKGQFVGLNNEFISSSRLDDLWMVHAGLDAILNAAPSAYTKLLYCPDNEEIGSLTPHGAQSSFIKTLIERITPHGAFGQVMANSFFISADLGHAQNPNHAGKDDPTNPSIMGEGPILKYSAMQKYATNGYTGSIFTALCHKAGVPVQKYITRSDVMGGGTIGAIMGANLGVNVVDMGLAVMGMHSIREFGATIDNDYILKVFGTFFDN